MAEESHPRAPQGTILKVEYIPIPGGEQIEARIILKGSPLISAWREDRPHHTAAPELHWISEDCIYCQQCNLVCKHGCLHISDDGLEIDREACTACADCARECPSLALEIIGESTTAADLLHKILRQNYAIARKIAQITLTGGEPGLQPAFCADLLYQLSIANKPCLLETCGHIPFENLRPLLDRPTVVRYELITINDALHQQLTGYGNQLILDNLELTAAQISLPIRLVVRTPLIRNRTATRVEIQATGAWLMDRLGPHLPAWELFEPKTVCVDTIPLHADELQQVDNWAKQVYPTGNITIRNHLGKSTTKAIQDTNTSKTT